MTVKLPILDGVILVCAWCPGFDPDTQAPHTSHGICPACASKLIATARDGATDCPACDGTGEVALDGDGDDVMLCPRCGGEGGGR
jgi:DnaJ-class molecular chaperone